MALWDLCAGHLVQLCQGVGCFAEMAAGAFRILINLPFQLLVFFRQILLGNNLIHLLTRLLNAFVACILSYHELVFSGFLCPHSFGGFLGQKLILQELIVLAVGRHILITDQGLNIVILQRVEVRLAVNAGHCVARPATRILRTKHPTTTGSRGHRRRRIGISMQV